MLHKKQTNKKNLPTTAAMRQAGNPSSIDRLRIREMSVSKRTIPGKSPAHRIAAERYPQAKKNRTLIKNRSKKPTAYFSTFVFSHRKSPTLKKPKELKFPTAQFGFS